MPVTIPKNKPFQYIEEAKTPYVVPGLDLKRMTEPQKEAKLALKVDNSSQGDSNQTVSSYRGIFNRISLPLPRSARVKVEINLVEKDPKISEQLKEIVNYKDLRGK